MQSDLEYEYNIVEIFHSVQGEVLNLVFLMYL